MTTPQPDLPSNVRGLPTRPPRAVFITADPLLAEHVAALDPRVHTTVLQQLPGTHPPQIPDTDGLLLIAGGPTDLTAATTGIATITRTLYVGTNLDDAAVWSRSADLHAHDTLLLPEDDDRLATEITTQLGPAPSATLTPGPGPPPCRCPTPPRTPPRSSPQRTSTTRSCAGRNTSRPSTPGCSPTPTSPRSPPS